MKLYSYFRSSATWRVRIALGLKRLAYEYVPVSLVAAEQHGAAYAAVNPQGQVPALEVVDGGRTVRLAQSLAIIEYLDERYPEPPLLPTDAIARARARQMAEVCNAGIQPLHNLMVLQELQRLGVDDKAWARTFIVKGLGALEALAGETAGTFLVGDAVTIADVCLVPQLGGARRFDVDLAVYPRLLAVEERCGRIEAFAAAHPSRQPDAPPA